jgi:tetratricopeptide (TPR) repeat protein
MGTAAFLRARVWHDSVTLWTDAYNKNPPIPQTAHSLGRAYRDAGDLRQALPYYRQALTFVPYDPLVLFNLADLYLRLDQREDAATLIQRMRTHLPANDLRILLIEGQYFMTIGDLPRAESLLLQALQVEPGHPDGLFRLGQVYARMDRLAAAQAAFLQTLQNGNRDPEVYYELACVETARGAHDQALQYLRAAIQRGFHNPLRLRSDNRLQPLRLMPEFRQLLAGG